MNWVCLIGAIYGFFQLFYIESNAKSVMHQIYGAEYGIMATIFVCTLFLLTKLQSNGNSKDKK